MPRPASCVVWWPRECYGHCWLGVVPDDEIPGVDLEAWNVSLRRGGRVPEELVLALRHLSYSLTDLCDDHDLLLARTLELPDPL